MPPWNDGELSIVIELVNENGPKWKAIEPMLKTRLPGRNVAQVRNAFLRMVRGQRMTSDGTAQNRCKKCGEPKIGHLCGGHVFGDLQSIVQRASKAKYKPRANVGNNPTFSIHASISTDTPMSPGSSSRPSQPMSSSASAVSVSELSTNPTTIYESDDEFVDDE